ncbi:MAG TPA: S8 family serine peptidase, partial [Lacipirellulaceae bacterium]|nr:S8 family serine peptidase [Lacipirellulaceae bacterium]
MKRRNWKSRQRAAQNQKPLRLFTGRARPKRKSWKFEQLEDRLVFSVSNVSGLVTTSFGNDTPQGAALTWLHEVEWDAVQAASAANLPAPDYLIMSLPNDPLFQNEWNLLNTGQEVGNPDLQSLFAVAGQDINVVPAWNMGYDGSGITVGVIDTGVQLTHPDLIANISPTLRFNAANGGSNVSPDLGDPDSWHGTAVAGIIGATGDNDLGVSGVA